MKIKAGSTNVSVYYYIVGDASNAAPGEPVTGLLFSDIETGGFASYVRQGAASTELTLITLASASATHADGGFILVDDSENPGLYRCDYPDAAFASGVAQTFCQIVVASANNAVAAPILVDIDGNIDQTGDNFARLGAPAGASVSADIADIPTVSEFNARTLLAASYFDPAADAVANVTLVATTTALTNVINAASIVASVSGNVDGSVDSVTGDTKQTADHTAAIADLPTVAEFNARTLLAASYFDPAADAVANVTLVATTTALTNVINAASVVASVSGNVDGSVDSVTGDTKQTADHTAAIAAIPTAIENRQEMDANSVDLNTIQANQTTINTNVVANGTAIGLLNDFDPATDTVVNVTTVATTTDVTNQVTANITAIGGDATAATNLSKSAIAIEPAAAIAGTLSTTQMSTDLTEATDDHFNGRIIIWTTGVLKNQATDITDYTGATKVLTFTATTEAPGIGDEFVII